MITEAARKWRKDHNTALTVGSVITGICIVLLFFAPGLPGYVNTLMFLVVAIAWGLFTWSFLLALSKVPTERAPTWRGFLLLLALAVALASPWWVPSLFARVFHTSMSVPTATDAQLRR
jgi:hypothetical protein